MITTAYKDGSVLMTQFRPGLGFMIICDKDGAGWAFMLMALLVQWIIITPKMGEASQKAPSHGWKLGAWVSTLGASFGLIRWEGTLEWKSLHPKLWFRSPITGGETFTQSSVEQKLPEGDGGKDAQPAKPTAAIADPPADPRAFDVIGPQPTFNQPPPTA
jgi:hypothetical protein